MNRIKLLRKEKDLLQEDLGRILNVSGRAIGNYETGKRGLDTEIASKLADFFDVSIDYLLGKSDIRNPEKVDSDKINIGLSIKDYTPPTKEQQEKIEEFAKFVLQDNKKNKEDK